MSPFGRRKLRLCPVCSTAGGFRGGGRLQDAALIHQRLLWSWPHPRVTLWTLTLLHPHPPGPGERGDRVRVMKRGLEGPQNEMKVPQCLQCPRLAIVPLHCGTHVAHKCPHLGPVFPL